MVSRCLHPISFNSDVHRRDSNCHPRSLVMVDGTPNRAIKPVANVRATVLAVISPGFQEGRAAN